MGREKGNTKKKCFMGGKRNLLKFNEQGTKEKIIQNKKRLSNQQTKL